MNLTLIKLEVDGRMVAFAIPEAEPECAPEDDFKCYVVTSKSGASEYLKAMSDDYASTLARTRWGSELQDCKRIQN